MPKNGTVAYVQTLPECDVCRYEPNHPDSDNPPRKAEYDLRTMSGQWANVCHPHRWTHAMYTELGVGKGQKLEVVP